MAKGNFATMSIPKSIHARLQQLDSWSRRGMAFHLKEAVDNYWAIYAPEYERLAKEEEKRKKALARR